LEQEPLLLDAAPLRPEDALPPLDLWVAGQVLGPDQRGVRRREGQITPGKTYIRKILPRRPAPGLGIVPDQREWDVYLVRVQFDIPLTAANRRIQRVTFTIEMSTPDTTAFQLIPELVAAPQRTISERQQAGPELEAFGVKVKVGEWERTVQVVEQLPVVTAMGGGQGTFGWHYRAAGGEGLPGGTRKGLVVLETPRDTSRLFGIMQWQVEMERHLLGRWHPVIPPPETDPVSFTWDVQEAPFLT
jgi:hypothetical protein